MRLRRLAREPGPRLIRAEIDVGVDVTHEPLGEQRRGEEGESIAHAEQIRQARQELPRTDLRDEVGEAHPRIDDRRKDPDIVSARGELPCLLEDQLLSTAGVEEAQVEDDDPHGVAPRTAGT